MSKNQETRGLNRRQFLFGAAGLSAGAALMLTGCGEPRPSAGTTSKEEDTVELAVADETVEADFIVVGGGMAGFSAAISAAQNGCQNIILLEKNNDVGGSTQFAEGIFGNGDRYQQEMGYGPYNLNEILADEVAWSKGVIDQSIFMQYMEDSADYVNWLMDLGVKFETIVDAGTGRFCLHIYEGGNGSAPIKLLKELASSEYGVDIQTNTPAVALLLEDDTVVGVQAQSGSKIIDFKAPTVCLATGGMASSDSLMDEYTKLDAGKWRHLGNSGQDGDGMKLAESTIHGRGKNVCAASMWLTLEGAGVSSNENFVAGMEGSTIWVNEKGLRYTDESIAQQFFICTNTVLNQGMSFSIFDQAKVDAFAANGTTCAWSGFCPFMQPIFGLQESLDEAAENENISFYKADTLEELAEMIGLDKASLTATVKEWNTDVVNGVDSQFGKEAAFIAPVSEGPFYAGKHIVAVLNTVGGVRINEKAQVVAPDGTVVEGLYAAGIIAKGFTGEVYGMDAPGTNQGPAVYLGRLSGRAAAERA